MLIPGSGDAGASMETVEDSRLWREMRELMVLATSRWSVSVVRRSLFLLLEKMERPPEDCLDLSADDMAGARCSGRSYVKDEETTQLVAQGRSHDGHGPPVRVRLRPAESKPGRRPVVWRRARPCTAVTWLDAVAVGIENSRYCAIRSSRSSRSKNRR